MGEAITTLEGCARLFSQRGTGGGMQAVDTNALSRDTPFHRLASEGYKTKTRGHSHAKQQLASEGYKQKTLMHSHAKHRLASEGYKTKTRGHSHAKQQLASEGSKPKTRGHSHAKHQLASEGCKQKTAYEILSGLVGSEMCIRDRTGVGGGSRVA